jgi:hypothetical protein
VRWNFIGFCWNLKLVSSFPVGIGQDRHCSECFFFLELQLHVGK